MAWKKVEPMRERLRFMVAREQGNESMSELCRRYSISRKTGYKWWKRYEGEGIEGVKERSRRPKRNPREFGREWYERIAELKNKHEDWGPKKISIGLRDAGYGSEKPALSTIGEILYRQGLVKPNRRRRRRQVVDDRPLTKPQEVNEVWTADYKGWFRTRDQKRCEPLTIKDLYSHYILAVEALPGVGYELARRVFERVFEEYGLPKVIRTDNGIPFASQGAAGLSRLSVWWLQLGIRPETIAPGHPEQNGSHERMHRTLKKGACTPPQLNQDAQQKRFDEWRQEYNEVRPHESIDMDRPAQRYQTSPRRIPKVIGDPRYPENHQIRRVRHSGEIKWKGRLRFVGQPFVGCLVGLLEHSPGRDQVFLCSQYLGDLLDSDTGGLRPTVSASRVRRKKTAKTVTHVDS